MTLTPLIALGLAENTCIKGDFIISIPTESESGSVVAASAGFSTALLAEALNETVDTINNSTSSDELSEVYNGYLSGNLDIDQYLVKHEYTKQVWLPASEIVVEEGIKAYVSGLFKSGSLALGNFKGVVGNLVSSLFKNSSDATSDVPDIFNDFCD